MNNPAKYFSASRNPTFSDGYHIRFWKILIFLSLWDKEKLSIQPDLKSYEKVPSPMAKFHLSCNVGFRKKRSTRPTTYNCSMQRGKPNPIPMTNQNPNPSLSFIINPWKSTSTKVAYFMPNTSNNNIRLIAVDLDGTLFNSDHRVSETTQMVLKQTLASGLQVILATGRNRTFVNNLLHDLDLDLPYICSGGAMLISGRDGEVLYSKILQLNGQLPAVISWAESHQTCLLAEYPNGQTRWYSTVNFLEQLPPGLRAEFQKQEMSINPLSDFAAPTLKICFIQAGDKVLSAPELKKVFPDFQFVYSGYNCLDLTALGVDKGTALAFYAEQFGYKQEEIVAIGDQTNDISMLRYAGLSFAMGGAPEEVKQAAGFTAPSNDENGAAWVMQNIHSFRA